MICLTVICFGHDLFQLRELTRKEFILDDPIVNDYLVLDTVRIRLEEIAATNTVGERSQEILDYNGGILYEYTLGSNSQFGMFAKSKLMDMYRVENDFHQRSNFENYCKTQS